MRRSVSITMSVEPLQKIANSYPTRASWIEKQIVADISKTLNSHQDTDSTRVQHAFHALAFFRLKVLTAARITLTTIHPFSIINVSFLFKNKFYY